MHRDLKYHIGTLLHPNSHTPGPAARVPGSALPDTPVCGWRFQVVVVGWGFQVAKREQPVLASSISSSYEQYTVVCIE